MNTQADDNLEKLKSELYLEAVKYSLGLIKSANKFDEELSSGNLAAINGILKFKPNDMLPESESSDGLIGLRLRGLIQEEEVEDRKSKNKKTLSKSYQEA